MAFVPERVSREELMQFLIIKVLQFSPQMKQQVLNDLKQFLVVAKRNEEARQGMEETI